MRVRGSVCHETDDERGRRVLYGSHNVLKADPWSECNPTRRLGPGAAGAWRQANNSNTI